MSGLTRIFLQNFRSYTKAEFEFGDKTIVIGNNGAGKSNLIEAIYLLAIGKSFRAERDGEMIAYEEQFSILNFQFEINEQMTNFRILINDRKKFEINGVPKRQIDFVGRVRAVLFAPQDMELVTGSPGVRRRYLDFVISQVDREYRRCLISYEKGLRQRNRLLALIRDNQAQRSQLFFWDKLLIKNGNYLTQKREAYLQKLGVEYDKSVISEHRLEQYAAEEVAAATTLVGPHRDDFEVLHNGRDVAKYGSRGEQRMAVLALKKYELEFLDSETKPLLLLDDIFSELDHRRREEVKNLVENYSGQVIMTSADEHLLPKVDNYRRITVGLTQDVYS